MSKALQCETKLSRDALWIDAAGTSPMLVTIRPNVTKDPSHLCHFPFESLNTRNDKH